MALTRRVVSGHTTAVALAMRSCRAVPLTYREHEIVRALALGYSNREVARQLHLSERTVKTYRARAGAKIGSASRPALTRYALDRRLIP